MSSSRFEQPGLRLRLGAGGRRIASQHRQLEALHARVRAALAQGTEPEALDAFARFREAWEAHAGLEEAVYFPALRGLRPALAERIEALCAEHAGFHEALERIAEGFADPGARDGAFERLAAAIAAHEAREEALIAEVTQPNDES